MSTGLEVVGIGARTPVGLSAPASAAAVRAGVSGIREFPFVTADGETMALAADHRLETNLEGIDRMLPLAVSAVDEAWRGLGDAAGWRGPVSVLLALPEVRPGFAGKDATAMEVGLSTHLRGTCPQAAVAVAGRGHAGVAMALHRAAQPSPQRDETLTVVVGVDSYHWPQTLMWLEQQRLFGADVRSGFTPGEAAGCLVLTPTRLRKRLQLPCLAKLSGIGTAMERLLADSETGSFGVGMTHAVRGAVAGLALPGEAVDDVYADINGERYRSEEWGFCAMRIHAAFRALEYHAPSDCWGDVGAATGALSTVLAVRSWARGYARGPRALVMTGSPSGTRGAILLSEPEP